MINMALEIGRRLVYSFGCPFWVYPNTEYSGLEGDPNIRGYPIGSELRTATLVYLLVTPTVLRMYQCIPDPSAGAAVRTYVPTYVTHSGTFGVQTPEYRIFGKGGKNPDRKKPIGYPN